MDTVIEPDAAAGALGADERLSAAGDFSVGAALLVDDSAGIIPDAEFRDPCPADPEVDPATSPVRAWSVAVVQPAKASTATAAPMENRSNLRRARRGRWLGRRPDSAPRMGMTPSGQLVVVHSGDEG